MQIQFAKINDVDEIIKIVAQAKTSLKKMHINQWQDNYPNEKTILEDINKHRGFILRFNHQVIAYFVLDLMGEASYKVIYDGEWLNNQSYGTIHRICIKEECKGKGYASDIIDFCKNYSINHQIFNLRIDTHQENKSMNKLIKKNKFKYCGIIYVNHSDKRLAYQLEF
jgi:ribosomal protein S18 acetylase RimI-like enzyme